MKLLLLLLIPVTLPAQSYPKSYWLGTAALSVGLAMDVHSSWPCPGGCRTADGRRILEAGLFRAPDGQLDTRKAITVNLAILGGTEALKRGLFRSHPQWSKAMNVIQFAVGGIRGGAAIRNYRVRR